MKLLKTKFFIKHVAESKEDAESKKVEVIKALREMISFCKEKMECKDFSGYKNQIFNMSQNCQKLKSLAKHVPADRIEGDIGAHLKEFKKKVDEKTNLYALQHHVNAISDTIDHVDRLKTALAAGDWLFRNKSHHLDSHLKPFGID